MHEERQIAALVQPDTIGCMFVCQLYVWISVAAVPKDVSSEQFFLLLFGVFLLFFLCFYEPTEESQCCKVLFSRLLCGLNNWSTQL